MQNAHRLGRLVLSSSISRSAPASAHDSESHTRMVTGGGGVSVSFTMSKWW
jgi:hypothetical protein